MSGRSGSRTAAVTQRALVALQIFLLVATMVTPAGALAFEPSPDPTPTPTAEPTAEPAPDPTPDPTAEPTPAPTPEPSAEPTPEPTPAPMATSPYLVTFVAGTSQADQAAALAAVGAIDKGSIPALRMHAIELVDGSTALGALSADPSVERLDADRLRAVEATPSDPSFVDQWALGRIGWTDVFGTVTLSGSAVVALLDTGVDASHPDLAGQLVAGTSIIAGGSATSDPHGHGTWLAGVIAAATDNATGVAGVGFDGVKVMPITVLDADGLGQDSDIIEGIVWAVQHGADVINMSFSNPGYSPALQAAVDYAWANDVVLVAAAGNDGASSVVYPAGDRGVIGVSNTTSADVLAGSSNRGEAVFLGAPGTDILTTGIGGGVTSVSGTSASSAMVAAAAAVLRAADPSASNGAIVGRLARSADAVGTVEETGNGRLNLARAIGDTSTDPVEPALAGAAGDGGPFVGPYVAAAKSLDIDFVGTGIAGATVSFSNLSPSASLAACTADCARAGLDNNQVGRLTATPGPGAVFAGWAKVSGANLVLTNCTGLTCDFSLNNSNSTISATFNAATAPKLAITSVSGGLSPTFGTSFSAVVQAQDSSGTPITVTSATTVSLSVSTGTGTVDGTIAGTIASGTNSITITGVTYSKAEAGVVLTATRTSGMIIAPGNSAAFTVLPRAITVTAAAGGKTYDGTTASSGTPTITSGSLASGDAVTLTQTFDSRNAGTTRVLTPAVAFTSGSAANYSITLVTQANQAITARALTITATDLLSKPYDGTTASAVAPVITAGAVQTGDTANFSQVFSSAGVGTGKTVTPSGTVSDGNSGANYTYTFVNKTNGSITARAITVTAAAGGKTYDGTTASSGTPTITSGSLASGDAVTLTQTFDSRNAGTTRVLTPAVAFTSGSAANYSITLVAQTNQTISQRPITVTAVTDTKTYDGNVASAGTPSVTAGSIAVGDTPLFSQSFDTANAGTGKTITPTGSVMDGNSGLNYDVTFASVSTGVINQRSITVTADAGQSKTYGTSDPVFTYTVTSGSLASGDAFTGALDRAVGENVGSYAIGQGDLAIDDGNGGLNYSLTFVSDDFEITKADTSVSITWNDSTYNGAANVATAIATGPVSSENPLTTPAITLEYFSGSTATGPSWPTAPTQVGTYTVLARFAGNANYNPSSATKTITITTAFRIIGFDSPVDMTVGQTRIYNSVKGGQTVPLKFRVVTLSGAEVTSTTGMNAWARSVTCATGAIDPTLLPTTSTNEAGIMRTGDRFHFNWKVPAGAGKCYQVLIQTVDGSIVMVGSTSGTPVQEAYFRTK